MLGAMCAGWYSVLITQRPTFEYVCPPSLTVRSLEELYFMFKEALECYPVSFVSFTPICSVVRVLLIIIMSKRHNYFVSDNEYEDSARVDA